LLLVAGAAGALFFYQPYGAILVPPLALIALILIPGKRTGATREQLRLARLNDLQQAGLSLRREWQTLADRPIGYTVAQSRWRVQREVLQWMSSCEERLRQFPEVGAIFIRRERKPDVIDDLDAALSTLSRLRRLVSLSRSLKLPI
jgi:hypothetical protein